MQQPSSVAGVNVFRELDGSEAATIFAHDLEQAIIDMLATDEFKERAKQMFLKSGRFGTGACFPVVFMEGKLRIKVFASVESARSKEKMPPAFEVDVNLQTGEKQPDSEEVAEAGVMIQRVVGARIETAVDKARLEVGLTPLVPTRTTEGFVVNAPGNHQSRKDNYEERFRKSKETVERKKAEREAAAMTEAEREHVLKEGEARNQDGK